MRTRSLCVPLHNLLYNLTLPRAASHYAMLCIINIFRRLRVVCLPAMACWRCQTTPLTISANHEGRPARGVAKKFPIDFRNVIAKSHPAWREFGFKDCGVHLNDLHIRKADSLRCTSVYSKMAWHVAKDYNLRPESAVFSAKLASFSEVCDI